MKVFGELEGAIMKSLWEGGELAVRDVHERLADTNGVAYTTVMTVMSRLAAKGILQRRMEDGVYLYRTRESVDGYFAGLCTKLVDTIRKEYGPSAAQAFTSEFGRKIKSLLAVGFVTLLFLGGVKVWAASFPQGELCRSLAICIDVGDARMTPAAPLSFLPQSRP